MTSTDTYPTDKHGWAELLPERQPSPSFYSKLVLRVPWVIIGAGLTGLACARRLAESHPEDEIILLDAREVGQGASGRNSGFAVAVSDYTGSFDINQIDEYRRINRINQAGLDLLRTQVSENSIDCQWHENGFYRAAATQASAQECRQLAHYLEALEIPHTILDEEALSVELGTVHYRVGVHVHQGALLQPAALVRGLADSLPKNVRLYENSPVRNIETGRPFSVELSGGTIKADKVILATNCEAGRLNILNRYVVASTLSGSFTRVLTESERESLGALSEWGVLSLHGGGATIRLTADHRLCLRNTAEFKAGKLLTESQLKERQNIHRASFEQRFPQLAHVPFEFAWSGVEGVTRNGTNFFGQQKPNLYYAGAYNGSGVTRGTAFGTALADLASGYDTPLVADCLALPAGQWVPPRPFLDLGAWWKTRSRFLGVGADR